MSEHKKGTELDIRDKIAIGVIGAVLNEPSDTVEQAAKELGIQASEYNYKVHWPRVAAVRAYAFADAMLWARDRTKKRKPMTDQEEKKNWIDRCATMIVGISPILPSDATRMAKDFFESSPDAIKESPEDAGCSIVNSEKKIVRADPWPPMMTEYVSRFVKRGTSKFKRGQAEHGGKITDRPALNEMRQDVIDLFFYMCALEDQIEHVLRSLYGARMASDPEDVKILVEDAIEKLERQVVE